MIAMKAVQRMEPAAPIFVSNAQMMPNWRVQMSYKSIVVNRIVRAKHVAVTAVVVVAVHATFLRAVSRVPVRSASLLVRLTSYAETTGVVGRVAHVKGTMSV